MINSKKETTVCEDVESVLKSCETALKCPLGKFYPNKNFGAIVAVSNDTDALLASARQALAKTDGVYVKNALLKGTTVCFEILINNEERTVSVDFEKDL